VAAPDGDLAVTLTIEDRLDVLDTVARLDAAASVRDVVLYQSLLTENAVMDGAMGSFRGREAIGQAAASVWAAEGGATVHLTLNAVVDSNPRSETEALATSVLLIMTTGQPPALLSLAQITQRLVKTADGWRLARRTIQEPG
jgi:hypothetical protein